MKRTTHSISRRRLGLLVGVWAALAGGALLAPACYGRNCEGGTFTYGLDAGQGQMLDENTWESSAQDSKWLLFPRQHAYVFTVPFGGRTPAVVTPYVSAQEKPNSDGQYTIGSGNLVEQKSHPNEVVVINDTCSDYYVRVVAWAKPFPPSDAAAPSPTTVVETDASIDAAAVDAGADAQ